jgi:uncharacterized protein YceK
MKKLIAVVMLMTAGCVPQTTIVELPQCMVVDTSFVAGSGTDQPTAVADTTYVTAFNFSCIEPE